MESKKVETYQGSNLIITVRQCLNIEDMITALSSEKNISYDNDL